MIFGYLSLKFERRRQARTNFKEVATNLSILPRGQAERQIKRAVRWLIAYGKGFQAIDKFHYIVNAELKAQNRPFSIGWTSMSITKKPKYEFWVLYIVGPKGTRILDKFKKKKEERKL